MRAGKPKSLGSSVATLVLDLTGGSDDDWWRWTRNWRLVGLSVRLVVFAVTLAIPMVFRGLVRRWALQRLDRNY